VKNMLKVLVIALTALAFSGVSFAADTATKSKPKAMSVTGAVTAVDAKAGTVSVKTKDKDLDLTATSKGKGALGKVKVGDMVKVSYAEKDGKMNASSITMVKAPSKAQAEKADTK
jgi:type IV secretory pathway VirB6-like protein